ncbi:MAG: alpha/beta hydrolase [Rubripirellula sp.]|nr:alpha/beta hydrolase [Rubripirellula sp.]
MSRLKPAWLGSSRLGSYLPLLVVLFAFSWVLVIMKRPCHAEDSAANRAGIVYVTRETVPLQLDFYLPTEQHGPAPLVVWVHGGAWRSGSRQQVPVTGLLDHGFAIASLDYRLSGDAPFPAQIHDIKAAIRYLRSNAVELGIDPDRIAIAGASAGGHLAALAGVSQGVQELTGLETNSQQPPDHVAAIVSFYGASNLETILQQSTPHGLGVRVPALQLLLRSQPDQKPKLARLASPVTHVDAVDPPLLLIHGDQDPQMPINQSHELKGAYDQAGVKVEFDVVHGGAHGGAVFYSADRIRRVAEFLSTSLAR